ncbi:MAG: CYTH domain-containing protein [Phascolarctobacterium sp.]|nr:CYTH domain-containing protein [Phascolarctobacterium sp.]
MKNVEIELKLLLGKRELKKLLASELLKGVLREGSEKKRNLVSSYYDTADFALKKNGIAYRVRDKGDGTFEATVKTDRKSNGGLSERVELNMPLAENVAVLEGFGELGLGYELTELAPDGVEKLFTVDVVRTTYLLDLDGAVAELAVDNGKIIAGKRKDDIDEIEIELVEGEIGALMNFAAKLAELVPVFTEKRSKFARGLALLGVEGDWQTGKVKVDNDANARLEVLKLVQVRGDSLLLLQNALKKTAKAGDVKQLVKDLQSLRSYVEFGKVFAESVATEKALSKIEEVLGVATKLQEIWKLQAMWEELVEKAEVLSNNVLAKNLTACEAEAEEALCKLMAKGELSVIVYNVVAWLYQSEWQNEEYLQLESTVRCRLQDWQDALGEAEALEDKLVLLNNIQCLAKSLNGKAMAKIADAKKKERRKVAEAVEKERAINFVQNLSKNSNSRVLNRDTGVVIGYLL